MQQKNGLRSTFKGAWCMSHTFFMQQWGTALSARILSERQKRADTAVRAPIFNPPCPGNNLTDFYLLASSGTLTIFADCFFPWPDLLVRLSRRRRIVPRQQQSI